MPGKVDFELQSMVRAMLESVTRDPLQTKISDAKNQEIPLAIHVLFRIALDEHGKNLPGIWRRFLLFTLESGAQNYHDLGHLPSSMNEWLAVDSDDYDKNQRIVADSSTELYNAIVTPEEQIRIRKKMPITGGFMSWVPGVTTVRNENCVTPLIYRTIRIQHRSRHSRKC
jgi:hypothetical protein